MFLLEVIVYFDEWFECYVLWIMRVLVVFIDWICLVIWVENWVVVV